MFLSLPETTKKPCLLSSLPGLECFLSTPFLSSLFLSLCVKGPPPLIRPFLGPNALSPSSAVVSAFLASVPPRAFLQLVFHVTDPPLQGVGPFFSAFHGVTPRFFSVSVSNLSFTSYRP